ncbi:type II toxin-antitoxin system PemK/MazF family toxin [Nitratifractor sp.]
MTIRRGEIYLADFGKSRDSFAFGKMRPVLVLQSDKLNFAIKEGIYRHLLVVPLSTQNDIVTEEFRYPIARRDALEADSFAVCNALCFLDVKYLKRRVATLNDEEMEAIGQIVKAVCAIE